MARLSQPLDSAGSQFFIMASTRTELDGGYAAFGQVTEGIEVIDEIVSVDRDSNDKPLENQTIKKISVDTHGVDYGAPEKVE